MFSATFLLGEVIASLKIFVFSSFICKYVFGVLFVSVKVLFDCCIYFVSAFNVLRCWLYAFQNLILFTH